MKTTSLLNLFTLLAFCAGQDQSPARRLLPFEGRLTDQNGTMVTNGVRLVQFKIYDAPSAGAAAWAGEIHRTTVNGGLVNVLLGTKTPFNGVNFERTLYLEITVDVSGADGQPDGAITAADPPMLPRQVLRPVVFSKESADSRLLNGYDWAAVFEDGSTNPATARFSGSRIIAQSITAAQIAPATVGSALRASGAVGSDPIAPSSVTLEKLAAEIAEKLIAPGTIVALGGPTNQVPNGGLLCNGATVSKATYPRLWSANGNAWGTGDSVATFNLPVLLGLFLRGVEPTPADRNPDGGARFPVRGGGNSGRNVGSCQNDAFKAHQHNMAGGFNGAPPSGFQFNVSGCGTMGTHQRLLD